MIDSIANPSAQPAEGELRAAFHRFVAGEFYRKMLESLRQTVGTPAYFDGGRAQRIYEMLFDQQVVDAIVEGHGERISEPWFEQFAGRMNGVAADHGAHEEEGVGMLMPHAGLTAVADLAAAAAAPTGSLLDEESLP